MSESFSTSAFSSVFGGSYDTHQIGYDASRCGRITIPSAIEHGNRFIDECLYTNWIEGKRMHVGKEEGWMEYSFLLWEEFRPVSIRRSWICGYGTYLSLPYRCLWETKDGPNHDPVYRRGRWDAGWFPWDSEELETDANEFYYSKVHCLFSLTASGSRTIRVVPRARALLGAFPGLARDLFERLSNPKSWYSISGLHARISQTTPDTMFPYPTCPFRFCNPWSNRSDNENIGMTAPLNRARILLWSTCRKGFHFKFDCQGAASDIITVTWPQLLVATTGREKPGNSEPLLSFDAWNCHGRVSCGKIQGAKMQASACANNEWR